MLAFERTQTHARSHIIFSRKFNLHLSVEKQAHEPFYMYLSVEKHMRKFFKLMRAIWQFLEKKLGFIISNMNIITVYLVLNLNSIFICGIRDPNFVYMCWVGFSGDPIWIRDLELIYVMLAKHVIPMSCFSKVLKVYCDFHKNSICMIKKIISTRSSTCY